MSEKDIIIQAEDLDRLAEIKKRMCDTVDECCMKLERDFNLNIKEIRRIVPPLANDIESRLLHELFEGRYGTGISAHLKVQIIQRLFDEYTGGAI